MALIKKYKKRTSKEMLDLIITMDPAAIQEVVETIQGGGEYLYALRKLQDNFGLHIGMEPRIWARSMDTFLASDEYTMLLDKYDPLAYTTKVTYARSLDVLRELESLTIAQRKRVTKLLQKENDMPTGLLLDAASREMRDLKSYLESLGKLQLETGVLQKATKKITGVIAGQDGKRHTFSWREEQETLMQELKNALNDS